MNKNIAIGILVAIVAVGAYFFYTGKSIPMMDLSTQNGATSTLGTGQSSGKHSVQWKFTEKGTDDASGAPKTQVTLVWSGQSYDAGTYNGSCAEMDGTNGMALEEGEMSAVLCWWAGGGDEIGVFREGDSFVLKHGMHEEPTAETAGFRGNFTTILKIAQ